MSNYNYEKQARLAAKLNELLGSDYTVRYDECESCFTNFYYKGVFYKRVLNDELEGSLNVYDFAAPTELKYRLRYSVR